MFKEAFTMGPIALMRELDAMGVDEKLTWVASGDVRLLRALYIYVLVESINA